MSGRIGRSMTRSEMGPDKAIQDSSPRKAEALVRKLNWKQVRTREIQDYT
jgi:hypothetical protein